MTMRKPARRMVLLVVVALVATACGGSSDPLEVGFRRVALDLAFKDAEKADPEQERRVIRRVIIQEAPEVLPPPEPLRRVRPPRPRIIPPRSEEIECPEAAPDATPLEPAFHIVHKDPEQGSYLRINDGAILGRAGAFEFDFPMPPSTRWRVNDVKHTRASSYVRSDDVDPSELPSTAGESNTAFPERTQFTLHRQITGTTSITDTFMYRNDKSDDEFLYLIKRVTTRGDNVSEFNPTPPVRYIPINSVEGTGVPSSGGTDRENEIAMVVESHIEEREWVDVCGEIVDTYRVRIREQFADLSQTPPVISGQPEPDRYSYWNIQYDNGLLIVRERADFTINTTTQIAGAEVPLQLDYKYTSTLSSMTPDPVDAED